LSGTVWEAFIIMLTIIIVPEREERGHWLRRILLLLGTMAFFIALIYLGIWVTKQTGIRSGIFLAMLALLAGIICQVTGGIFHAADARPASGLGGALVDKIRGL
jgi:hypothetical protein